MMKEMHSLCLTTLTGYIAPLSNMYELSAIKYRNIRTIAKQHNESSIKGTLRTIEAVGSPYSRK